MTTPPTRCCAPATSGRCANTPAPFGQTRYIGPVEIAACNLPKHQDALKALPAFERREGYCGAKGCCTPSTAGLCETHRNLYRRHGVLPRLLIETTPRDPPMSVATIPAPELPLCPPPTPEVPDAVVPTPPTAPQDAAGEGAKREPHPLETRRDALVARLLAAGFVEVEPVSEHIRRFTGHDRNVLIPVGHPCEVEYEFGAMLDKAEEQCATVEAAKQDRQGDAVEPVAPTGPPIAMPPGPIIGYAPSPALAALQADRDCERKRANEAIAQLHDAQEQLKAITALLDADPERSPAWDGNDQPIPLPCRVEIALMSDGFGKSEIERRITAALDSFDAPKGIGSLPVSVVGRVMATARDRRDFEASRLRYREQEAAIDCLLADLGAGLEGSTLDRLLQVLPVEDRRALLELEAAEHRFELARLKARRLDPPTPEKLAEYQRKLDIVEAKLCSLDCDHSPDVGKKVE